MLFHKYVVIGAGETGLLISSKLASSGHDVLLIEGNSLGGSYIYSYDYPKYFMQELAGTTFKARKSGVKLLPNWEQEIPKILELKLRNQLIAIKAGQKKLENLKFMSGQAKFSGPNMLEVIEDGVRQIVGFEQCIIATGQQKMEAPAINNIQEVPFLYQHNAFFGGNIPKSLAVVGCTQENLEVADLYASLGCRVSIFEPLKAQEILPGHDTTTLNYLIQNLLRKGVEFYFEAAILRVENMDNQNLIRVLDSDNQYHTFEGIYCQVHEYFQDTLGLSALDLKFSREGIVCNSDAQSQIRNIFVLGHAAQNYRSNNYNTSINNLVERFGSAKISESGAGRALVLFNNAISGLIGQEIPDIDFNIFTISLERPVATLGLSYRGATARFGSVAKFEILFHNLQEGFIKIIYNDQTGQIYGLAMAGEVTKINLNLGIEQIYKNQNLKELKSILFLLGFHR